MFLERARLTGATRAEKRHGGKQEADSFDDGQNLRGKANLNVLMHVQKETAADLPSFIDFLKQSGFSFASP